MTYTALPEGFEPYDFHEFHRRVLPERLAAGNGALAAADAARIGPIAFQVEDASYTYVPREGGIDVVEGDADAKAVVGLDLLYWQGLVHDLESAPGLLYPGRARRVRGDLMRFVRWEPALRAMFHGRPLYDDAHADLRDRHGDPLDVERAFTLDDDREEMAHFLRAAGFLRVRGVFDADEVARFNRHAARLRAEAVEGDRKSWWAKDADGRAVCCRVTRAGAIPELAALPRDPRLAGLAALSEHDLRARGAGQEEGVSILWKTPGMAEGLSDLPWHRDCGMGGHAVMCPLLICTANIQDGTPEAGELRVLPGSHAASHPFIDARDPRAPKGVSLATRAGDVSFHYGDLMHAAPPPTRAQGPHRISLLTAWVGREARHHRGERAYNDVLLDRDDGQVEHLADRIGRD
jgi:ectoine hydroxylase-related dioxygenase (phytanoyl-CoA dioxygenase family)